MTNSDRDNQPPPLGRQLPDRGEPSLRDSIGDPFFFVIGAPRCATTSLFAWFDQHSEVFAPKVKEPHYFSHPEVSDTYYNARLISDLDEYSNLFTDRPAGMLAGEFSSSYLFRSDSAQRIAEVSPHAKIVAVLRNPVERAVSHYRLDVREGYTTERLQTLLATSFPDQRFRREYVDVGCYSKSIEKWEQVFPSEQMHFIFYDDLVADWDKTTGELSDFLEISTSPNNAPPHINESTGPRRPAAKALRTVLPMRWVADRLPPTVRGSLIRKLSTDAAEVDPQAIEVLHRLFDEEITALEAKFGRDLSHWRYDGVSI